MNCVKRFLLICLLAFTPVLGFAQTLVNCAPATPCTISGPANTGTGDRAWLAFGKINTDLLVLAPLFNSTGLPFTLPVISGGTGATTLTGLVKGNGTSAFSAATSADVISRWTGTCNATTFLRADGSCQAAAGDLTAATYAAARLLVGVSTGDRLVILGRATKSDGGQGLFTWVAGGTTTVDDGYVLQATGGIWQRVDTSPEIGVTRLNAVWYNIKPTNADTVNDTGFAKLKAQMQTSGTTTWRVFFPPGAYTYQNNRWLFGVQKYIIDAYDSTFQSTNTDGTYANGIPISVNNFFQDWGDIAWPGTAVYHSGYLINTTVAAATSVTTTTHADAGNFTPGMRVVVHGYDQQFAGYPPNMRYFEYKTVLTANSGTGVVTFTDPVQFFYDSRWWDTNYGSGLFAGAPRIMSLERANFKQAKLAWVKGASFLANPTNSTSNSPDILGDLVIFEDTQSVGINVAMSDKVIFKRHKNVGYQATPDKMISSLVMEDSIIDPNPGSTQAFADSAGVVSLSIIRTKFYGSIYQVSPRSLSVDDCDIIPQSGYVSGIGTGGGSALRSAVIRNTRVHNTGGGLTNGFTNVGTPGLALTVGSVVGTDIRITFDATGKAVAGNIEYGQTITNPTTGNTGIITAIYYETGSPGTLRIAGTWAAPTAGDVFRFYDVINAYDGGGNVIIGPQVPFWRGPPGPTIVAGATVPGTLTATEYDFTAPGSAGIASITGVANVVSFQFGGANSFQIANNALYAQKDLNMASTATVALGITPLKVPEAGSATAIAGVAVLVGGTKVVSNTTVFAATSRVKLNRSTPGGTLGHLSYTIIDGTSFTILSSSGTDTSTVEWSIVQKL